MNINPTKSHKYVGNIDRNSCHLYVIWYGERPVKSNFHT